MNLFQRRKRKKTSSKILFERTFRLLLSFTMVIFLLLASFQVFAANDNAGHCPDGLVKDENSPFTYTGDQIITSVGVKAGSNQSTDGNACTILTSNGSNGCYTVTGLGTNNVIVTKTGSGPNCKDISYAMFYAASVTNTPTITPPQPTTTPTNTPTNTPPIPTNTPTNTPTPTITNTPTPTVTTPSLTPTRGASETPTPGPTSTSTPGPSSTPVPGPSATPGPGPTSTPGPGPTSTPGPIGGGITNPSVLGVISGVTPTTKVKKVNPSVKGITKGSQILGEKTKRLPKTGTTIFTDAPTNNEAIDGEYIYIPRIQVMQSIYKAQKIGDEYLVGSSEVLKADNSQSIVLYGHNTNGTFGQLPYVKLGDSVIYTKDAKHVQYKVTTISKVADTNTEVLESDNPYELTLITCDTYNPSIRFVVTAVRQ